MNKIHVKNGDDGIMPHSDLMLCFAKMRKLTVCIGGKKYTGDFEFHEEDGCVELHFPQPRGRPKTQVSYRDD